MAYNNVAKASHVKDKIIEMNHLNETLYCGCIACASEGFREASGTYSVNTLLANIHKQNVTRFPYDISRIAQDIAVAKSFAVEQTGKVREIVVFRVVGRVVALAEAAPDLR